MASSINTDSLLSELDESIPQGIPNDTKLDSSDFADLDDLLADSLDEAAQREQYAADLKARKSSFNGMSKEEIDFCNSRMAVFEATRIWRPTENIAVFATITCLNCGDRKRIFSRWMQKQQSRTNASTRRVVTLPGPMKSLHSIVAEEQRTSALCVTCAFLDFELDTHSSVSLDEAMNGAQVVDRRVK